MLTILLCAVLCADESREAAIAAARTKYRTLALASQQEGLEDSLRRTKGKEGDVGEMTSFVPTKQLEDGRLLVSVLDTKTNRETPFVLDAPAKQFKLYSNCGTLDPCWVSGKTTVGEKSVLVVELLPLDGLPHQRGLRTNR